ncbi:hypothetical protein, partial [Acidithiobacillus sp.]|uniref:hypothetical protein n=1 Tax=Acidithiobacillus sp. TaxID=1872118 RepID=UPI003CFE350E
MRSSYENTYHLHRYRFCCAFLDLQFGHGCSPPGFWHTDAAASGSHPASPRGTGDRGSSAHRSAPGSRYCPGADPGSWSRSRSRHRPGSCPGAHARRTRQYAATPATPNGPGVPAT